MAPVFYYSYVIFLNKFIFYYIQLTDTLDHLFLNNNFLIQNYQHIGVIVNKNAYI